MMAGNMEELKKALALSMFDKGIVKFGSFTLKSGLQSPFYLDIRTIVSYPATLKVVGQIMWNMIKSIKHDVICGVPYTALPIATVISTEFGKPMIMKRKEQKKYGTKKIVEGVFKENDTCIIIEDLVTSGMSVFETVGPLQKVGLVVKDVVVLVDREQGGRANVQAGGLNLHSVFTISEILNLLQSEGRIKGKCVDEVMTWIRNNQTTKKSKPKPLTFSERASLTNNPVAQNLFNIMETKKTNLCFSADVTTLEEVKKLADLTGPYICLLKTHVDIYPDYSEEGIKELKKIAQKHNFLIFEDRKFADIGNTMFHQFSGGTFKISSWADITNAHTLPGPGIIDGFKKVINETKSSCGLLLLAQMSSKGNLITKEYTKETVALAEKNLDSVLGFICQNKLSDKPGLIHMTPGVNLKSKGDSLGQQYNTPEIAVGDKGTDLIIVGRGIYKDPNPATSAQNYAQRAWKAYESRISSNSLKRKAIDIELSRKRQKIENK